MSEMQAGQITAEESERMMSAFRVEMGLALSYLPALFAGFWSAISALATFVSLGIGILGPTITARVNREIWFTISACAFVLASYLAWRRERIARSRAFRLSYMRVIRRMLRDTILGWEKLNEDYQNFPKDQKGDSASLPNPMDPAWVSYGFKVLPYRVGKLQSVTLDIRTALAELGTPLEPWNSAYMSLAELLGALRRYLDLINDPTATLSSPPSQL